MEFEWNRSAAHAGTLWMSPAGSKPDDPASASELAVLVDQAGSGDAAAFEQLLIRTERRVLNLALRLLGSVADAEDAAQEVFLRAFKYLHRFDTRKPFEPWLIGIAVNVCRDVMRGRQQSRSVFSESEYSPERAASGEAEDPHSILAVEQKKQILRKALSELPEKERLAIVLRDLEGFTTAEVAEILGSSEATVRSQISSARLKMRNALKGGRR